jgi:hypothetical protein
MNFNPSDDLFQVADSVEKVDLLRQGQIYARRVRAIRRRPSNAERTAFPALTATSQVWLLCGLDFDAPPESVDEIHTPRGVYEIFAATLEAYGSRWRCLADLAESQESKSTGF